MKRGATAAVAGLTFLANQAGAAGLVSDGASILAQLSPRQQTVLSSEISARIEKLPLKEGMTFEAGQELVEFDCLVGKARLEKAEATAVAAEKKLAIIQQLQEYRSSTKLEEAVAAAEVAKTAAEVNEESAVVSKCTLTAPFAGKISEINVFRYQFVRAGDPLMKIIDDSTLEVEFLAPSSWLTWLEPGFAFQINVSETGSSHSATVVRVGANIDPVSHTVKVIGQIDERSANLIAGMTGRVLMKPPAGGL